MPGSSFADSLRGIINGPSSMTLSAPLIARSVLEETALILDEPGRDGGDGVHGEASGRVRRHKVSGSRGQTQTAAHPHGMHLTATNMGSPIPKPLISLDFLRTAGRS